MPQVSLHLRIEVSDPEVLIAKAKERYAACWLRGDWTPKDIGEAVLEVVALSNHNPSPEDDGYSFVNYSYEIREDK